MIAVVCWGLEYGDHWGGIEGVVGSLNPSVGVIVVGALPASAGVIIAGGGIDGVIRSSELLTCDVVARDGGCMDRESERCILIG